MQIDTYLSKKNLQIDTCRKVENVLKRFDRKGSRAQVLPFHAAVTQESRLANIKEFTSSQSDEVSQFLICTDRYFIFFLCRTYLYCLDSTSVMARLLALLSDETQVIVTLISESFCRASRGIDFAGVDHVVLFDFPRDPSEYVRRVGRTARGAGGKGKAFIFVVGKQISLARKIMERNQKGHPLHDLPC